MLSSFDRGARPRYDFSGAELPRKRHAMVLGFPCFHQRDKRVETITLRRIEPRIHQPLNLFEGAAVVPLSFDRCDFHVLSIPSPLVRDYVLCRNV